MTSDKQITISYGPVCKWHDSFEDEDGNTCEGYWTDTGDYEYSVHAGKGRSKYGFDTKKEALNALDQAQHKTKIKDLCSEIEQEKDWLSLWDVSR